VNVHVPMNDGWAFSLRLRGGGGRFVDVEGLSMVSVSYVII